MQDFNILRYDSTYGGPKSITKEDIDTSNPADLPQRWIGHSAIDMIVVRMDDLKSLQKNDPDRLAELRRWTSAGGVLVISDITWFSTALKELETLLSMRSLNVAETLRGWKHLGSANRVQRDLGFGWVIASRNNEQLTINSSSLDSAKLITVPNRGDWEHRQGISSDSSDDSFWNFLIPGVGLVPVWQFLVLISAFVILVGPVNYHLLRKAKRLSLLILTVPAGAAVVTLCLIGYALIADGLGVRVRARSLTQIDQTAGEAVCCARLSYYAGLSPSGGLTFHDDTAVCPLESPQSESHSPRVTVWNGDEQRLVTGWLNSRTPTQLLTTRARASKAKLNIQVAADGTSVKVENQLGTNIQKLLVIDAEGRIYAGDNIAAEKIVKLDLSKDEEAKWSLRNVIIHNQPAIPEDFSQMNQSGGRRRGWTSYPQSYRSSKSMSNNGLPSPTQQTSQMETAINQLVVNLLNKKFEPKSYIAIVDRSPEVEFGTSVSEEASLHIIVGRW